ncbi:LamG-like jellyroll fold domain-containing protein [Halocola ammonii]
MKSSYISTLFAIFFSSLTIGQTPMAEYPLDGNADDLGAGSYHGIVHGAVPATDRFGNSASALSFDGEDDYIEVPYVSPFNFGTQDFAISVWIKIPRPDRSSGGSVSPGMIVNKGGESGVWRPGYWLRAPDLYNDNHIAWFTGNAQPGAPYAADDQIILDDGEWHHIVAQRVGTVIELYVDGVLLDTDSSYIRNVNDQNGLLIGAQNPNPDRPYIHHHFLGYIDDLAFFPQALSQEQINELCEIDLSLETATANKPLVIAPNPFSTQFEITGEYSKFELYDLQGKLIFSRNATSGPVPNLNTLRDGTYILKVYSDGQSVAFRRLIKQ